MHHIVRRAVEVGGWVSPVTGIKEGRDCMEQWV